MFSFIYHLLCINLKTAWKKYVASFWTQRDDCQYFAPVSLKNQHTLQIVAVSTLQQALPSNQNGDFFSSMSYAITVQELSPDIFGNEIDWS